MARTKARPKSRPGSGDSGRSISYQLRAAIRGAGESLYQLGRRAEVDPGSISRFLSGERDIGISIVDRLAEALRLKLADRGGRGRKRGDEPDDQAGDLVTTVKQPAVEVSGVIEANPGRIEWDGRSEVTLELPPAIESADG